MITTLKPLKIYLVFGWKKKLKKLAKLLQIAKFQNYNFKIEVIC
jgi:hypothetical protein